jgi:hypothetical protein
VWIQRLRLSRSWHITSQASKLQSVCACATLHPTWAILQLLLLFVVIPCRASSCAIPRCRNRCKTTPDVLPSLPVRRITTNISRIVVLPSSSNTLPTTTFLCFHIQHLLVPLACFSNIVTHLYCLCRLAQTVFPPCSFRRATLRVLRHSLLNLTSPPVVDCRSLPVCLHSFSTISARHHIDHAFYIPQAAEKG